MVDKPKDNQVTEKEVNKRFVFRREPKRSVLETKLEWLPFGCFFFAILWLIIFGITPVMAIFDGEELHWLARIAIVVFVGGLAVGPSVLFLFPARDQLVVTPTKLEFYSYSLLGRNKLKGEFPRKDMDEVVCRDLLNEKCVLEFRTRENESFTFGHGWEREEAEEIIRCLKQVIPKLWARLSFHEQDEKDEPRTTLENRTVKPKNSPWHIGPDSRQGTLEFFDQGKFKGGNFGPALFWTGFFAIFLACFGFIMLSLLFSESIWDSFSAAPFAPFAIMMAIGFVISALYLAKVLLEPFRATHYLVTSDELVRTYSLFGMRFQKRWTLPKQTTLQVRSPLPSVFMGFTTEGMDICFQDGDSIMARWPRAPISSADWITTTIRSQLKGFEVDKTDESNLPTKQPSKPQS